ncbi:MAG: hypothetical protein HY240_03640 [Actinobacteria bacterium]|nr:hypothetical protein [Actinomycetota bacterium]
MDRMSGKRGFSGQSLGVVVGSESVVFGGSRSWSMTGGGSPLNRVLGRALDESFTHLRFLDEYGETVFNTFQMEGVIPELHRLRSHAETNDERAVVESVIEMAETVRAGTHLYLVFVGD